MTRSMRLCVPLRPGIVHFVAQGATDLDFVGAGSEGAKGSSRFDLDALRPDGTIPLFWLRSVPVFRRGWEGLVVRRPAFVREGRVEERHEPLVRQMNRCRRVSRVHSRVLVTEKNLGSCDERRALLSDTSQFVMNIMCDARLEDLGRHEGVCSLCFGHTDQLIVRDKSEESSHHYLHTGSPFSHTRGVSSIRVGGASNGVHLVRLGGYKGLWWLPPASLVYLRSPRSCSNRRARAQSGSPQLMRA